MGQPRKHTRGEEAPCFENTGQAWLLRKNSTDPGGEIVGDRRCGGIRVSQGFGRSVRHKQTQHATTDSPPWAKLSPDLKATRGTHNRVK